MKRKDNNVPLPVSTHEDLAHDSDQTLTEQEDFLLDKDQVKDLTAQLKKILPNDNPANLATFLFGRPISNLKEVYESEVAALLAGARGMAEKQGEAQDG